jgi:hypothetical protein
MVDLKWPGIKRKEQAFTFEVLVRFSWRTILLQILHTSLPVLYSLRPKLLECFDWNTNIKESMRNLWKRPTRI